MRKLPWWCKLNHMTQDESTQAVTPATLRTAAEAALKAPGKKRLNAVKAQAEAEEVLLPLVLEAHRNEVSFRRINELTGIAPNTVRAWVARHSG